MIGAFDRALEAEVKAATRALIREMDRQIMGPPWLASDRWYYRWPELDVCPAGRWVDEQLKQLRRRRWEARRRVDLAWEMLKGADPHDW